MPIQQISEAQEHIVSTIRRVADTHNADFKYLLNQAKVESGLDPHAKASTSSATGLFQFTSNTWLNMVRLHGESVGLGPAAQSLRSSGASSAERAQILELRNDPQISTALAAHLAADNAQSLAASGHKSIGPTELYMAHFLGAAGANTFLNGLRDTPNAPAANALPAAAAANTGVFFNKQAPLSYQAIYERFAQKFTDAINAPQPNHPPTKESSFAALENAGTFDTRLKEIVASAMSAFSANRTQAPPAGPADAPSGPPVTEAAMTQFLKNFSLVDQSSGMVQIGDVHARDASQASTGNSDHAPISEQSVSPLISGARLILKASDPK